MSLGELFVKMGFKVDNLDALKQFDEYIKKTAQHSGESDTKHQKWKFTLMGLQQKLKDTVGTMNAYRMEMVASAAAVVALVNKTSNYAMELSKFSTLTGMSTQKLQEWQLAAAQSGIAGDEVAKTIQNLQRVRTEMELGQGDPGPWKLLGLDPRQDPFALLDQLKGRLNAMPTALGTKVASDIGLSDEMIMFLKTAKEGAGADKTLIMSEKEIKRLKEFHMLFNRIWEMAKRTMDKFAIALSPVATSIVNVFERFLRGARTFIDVATDLWDSLGPMQAAFIAFGAAVVIALFPMEALIFGALVAMEDFATFLRGGDSYFGSFIDWMTELINRFDVLKTAVTWINEAFDWGVNKIAAATVDTRGGTPSNTDQASAIARVKKQKATLDTAAGIGIGQPVQNTSNATFNNQIIIDGSKSSQQQASDLNKHLQNQMNNGFFQLPMPERAATATR